MKGDELTNRSIKTVKDEFINLLNHTPQYEIDYFQLARTNL